MSKETSLQKEFMPEYVMQEQTKEQVRILAVVTAQGRTCLAQSRD